MKFVLFVVLAIKRLLKKKTVICIFVLILTGHAMY